MDARKALELEASRYKFLKQGKICGGAKFNSIFYGAGDSAALLSRGPFTSNLAQPFNIF